MNEIKWNNLKRIYVFLRYDIENENNDNVINIIIDVLSEDLNNEEMCRKLFMYIRNVIFRKALW